MADQKRWFKVWATVNTDPGFQAMSLEDIGRWMLLGALTASVGTSGVLRVPASGASVASMLRLPDVRSLKSALASLPNVIVSDAPLRWPHGHDKPPVCDGVAWRGRHPLSGRGTCSFEEWCTRDAEFVVTFKNWHIYQRDSTAAERMKALRSKRRGEEIRGDKKRTTPPKSSSSESERNGSAAPPGFKVPERILAAVAQCPRLGKAPRLQTPAYWQAQIRAFSGVDFVGEVRKAEAWLTANPSRATRYRQLDRFLANWLSRAADDLEPAGSAEA